MLQNHYEKGYGYFSLISDVLSTSGVDRVNANPQQYVIRKAEGYFHQQSWDQYGGTFNHYFNDVNKTQNTIVFPSELDWLRSYPERITPDWARLQERNLEKVFNQLRGNSEIFVDLAESSQTVKMLKSVASLKKNIIKFLSEVATKPKRARRLATKAAGKWLEYRYGWLPLISSVYDASENLRKKVLQGRIRVKARSSYDDTLSWHNQLGTPGTQGFLLAVNRAKLSCWHEYGFTFRAPSPSAQQVMHWTSLNPASIAWELVPFSFVVDWFVNVGDNLRAWENHVIFGSLFESGYETRVTREERDGSYHLGIYNPVPQYNDDGSLNSTSYLGSREDSAIVALLCRKQRVKLTSLPSPVGFRVKVNLNANRATDLIALTSNKWKRFL